MLPSNFETFRASSVGSVDRTSPSYSQSATSAVNPSPVEPQNIKSALKLPFISKQPQSDPELTEKPGYRAAEAYIRPSALATHGKLENFSFNLKDCIFRLTLIADTSTPEMAPTVIYLPEFHFPHSHATVSATGGKWIVDRDEFGNSSFQTLKWWHGEGEQEIKIEGVKHNLGHMSDTSDDEWYLEQCRRSLCVMM